MLLCVALILSLMAVEGFRIKSTHTRGVNPNIEMKYGKPLEAIKAFTSKSKLLPAVLGGAMMMLPLAPQPAEALQGGRSGGSSFRSSPSRSYGSSTRSYGSRGGYGGSYSSVMPMPMYGGYGYGGFGGFGISPFGISPFGFMPINPSVLLLGAAAYVAYNVLSSRIGGADFSNSGETSSLGDGATLLKVQVMMDADWRSGNIMETMSSIASRNGMLSGRSELSKLLSEASIALLRRQNEWSSAAVTTEKYNRFNCDKIEADFQRMAVVERTKFDEEVGANTAGDTSFQVSSSGSTTACVVSLVVAVRGQSDAAMRVRNSADLRSVLQILASEALTDDGDNIMGMEMLWTPSEVGTVITDKEIIASYPEMIML